MTAWMRDFTPTLWLATVLHRLSIACAVVFFGGLVLFLYVELAVGHVFPLLGGVVVAGAGVLAPVLRDVSDALANRARPAQARRIRRLGGTP